MWGMHYILQSLIHTNKHIQGERPMLTIRDQYIIKILTNLLFVLK